MQDKNVNVAVKKLTCRRSLLTAMCYCGMFAVAVAQQLGR